MIFYAAGVAEGAGAIMDNNSTRKRKSVITTAEVYNPFAYRGINSNKCCSSTETSVDSSDSSLDMDDATPIKLSHKKSSSSSSNKAAIVTLVLVGFAAGLLCHLILSSKAAAATAQLQDDMALVHPDVLIKKLAQVEQVQEQELERLRRMVAEHEKQYDEKQRQRIAQQHEAQEGKRQKATVLLQMADEKRQEERQRLANLPPKPAAVDATISIYAPPENEKPKHSKRKRYFSMNDPEVAKAHLVGRYDAATGEFIRNVHLRGRGNSAK